MYVLKMSKTFVTAHALLFYSFALLNIIPVYTFLFNFYKYYEELQSEIAIRDSAIGPIIE